MLCIYSSFLIQRRGLRLREEAMVLCFTEIELCFRDIYEKEKRKGSVITCVVHTRSNFLIHRRSLCLRGEVTV